MTKTVCMIFIKQFSLVFRMQFLLFQPFFQLIHFNFQMAQTFILVKSPLDLVSQNISSRLKLSGTLSSRSLKFLSSSFPLKQATRLGRTLRIIIPLLNEIKIKSIAEVLRKNICTNSISMQRAILIFRSTVYIPYPLARST